MENLNMWPLARFPKEDELFSSWTTRVAHMHYQKIYTFYKTISPKTPRLWNSDIDFNVDKDFLRKLSERTCISREKIENTTLLFYEERLFLKRNIAGLTRWILATGNKNTIFKRRGLMFCPKCLKRDQEEPYFRKKWRLAISICCIDCKTWLNDHCEKCGSPVCFTRHELGKKNTMPNGSITYCFKCGFDLRDSTHQKAEAEMVQFQKRVYQYIAQKYTSDLNYSHLYFDGLYQIIRILNSENAKSTLLKDYLSKKLDLKINYEKAYKFELFEEKGIEQRIQILKMANYLTKNWPDNFLQTSILNKIWAKTWTMTIKKDEDLPFWIWGVIYQNLNNKHAKNDKRKLDYWRIKQKRLL